MIFYYPKNNNRADMLVISPHILLSPSVHLRREATVEATPAAPAQDASATATASASTPAAAQAPKKQQGMEFTCEVIEWWRFYESRARTMRLVQGVLLLRHRHLLARSFKQIFWLPLHLTFTFTFTFGLFHGIQARSSNSKKVSLKLSYSECCLRSISSV